MTVSAAVQQNGYQKAILIWLQTVLIALVLTVLPLANGGVSESARALATVLVVLALLSSIVSRLYSQAGFETWDRIWLLPWITLTALIFLHLLPLPSQWLNYVGAYPDQILQEPGLEFIRQITPNPAATLSYWAMFTTYWSVAYMVARLPRPQLRLVVLALILIISFEALYGLIAHLGRHETVLGLWPANRSHYVVLGTYFNRNHIAGLLELGLPIGIAFLLYGVSTSNRLKAREVRYFWLICFCALTALALFNTQSRLGSVGGLLGVMVFMLFLRYEQKRGHLGIGERIWLATAGGLALLGAIWFGLGPLLSRYVDILDGAEISRLDAWARLFDLPAKTWLLGAGAGAFADVFKLVQTADLRPSYAYLHNDWLQFLLEFGLIGTVLSAFTVLIWWHRVKPKQFGGLRAGACGGIAALALHSVGDFNLQIPGTAFALWVAVGILCNRHLGQRSRRRQSVPAH